MWARSAQVAYYEWMEGEPDRLNPPSTQQPIEPPCRVRSGEPCRFDCRSGICSGCLLTRADIASGRSMVAILKDRRARRHASVEMRRVVVERIYEQPCRSGRGVRFEAWCCAVDDGAPEQVVAYTFDPFMVDTLNAAKRDHRPVVVEVVPSDYGVSLVSVKP